MTDPSFIPPSGRELVAVYPDRNRAEAARIALHAAGVPDADIHVAEVGDIVSSLRSEQADEMARAWVVPNAGVVYPAGSARGLSFFAVVGVAIGLIAAFPLALIDVGSTYWARWLIWAVVGAGFGLAVALVAGPAAGAPRPGATPSAERGVTVRVAQDTEQLRQALAGLHPLRLDEVDHDGDPIETLIRERPDSAGETAKDIAANVEGDDYHPER